MIDRFLPNHGEIFVASTFGEGATFSFTIPKKQSIISQKIDLKNRTIGLQKEAAN